MATLPVRKSWILPAILAAIAAMVVAVMLHMYRVFLTGLTLALILFLFEQRNLLAG